MLSRKISGFLRQIYRLPDISSENFHISRRFLRGSKFPKISKSSTAEEGREEDSYADIEKDYSYEHKSEERHDQYQNHRGKNRRNYRDESEYRQHNEERFQEQDYQQDFSENLRNGRNDERGDYNYTETPERLPFDRKQSVKRLMKQATSTYGAPIEGGKIGGDPFLTGPYVREFKQPINFDQGNDAVEESRKRKLDPANTSVIMFPGQGTQFVGMCGDVSSLPRYVTVLYEIASSILDYDLLDLCANGPQEKLNQTVYSQPAILVSSLAALERLRDTDPESIEKCVSVAGFSIGEITSLVFAGVMSFEDAVRLVKVRAEAMQLASEITPSGMSTILYGADSKLNYALLVAREWCRREYNIENPVCSIANYLFPHCKVVAGNIEALEFLEMNYKDFNLRKVKRLPVSGAFHTDIMRPAADPMKQILRGMTLNRPRMPVFSNVTGYRHHSSDEVFRNLPKQVYKPVMWEQVLHTLYKRPKEHEYPNSFECGPGSSLTTVLKQVNAKAHRKCKSITSG